jgi:uncharacterized membrane protein
MNEESVAVSPALRIAAIAVLAAVTTVLTLVVRIPLPAQGYFNLGDVAIVFTAIAIGPFSAAISGGLGTALADLIGGYPSWAPISLVVHGLQGLFVGLVAAARPGNFVLQVVSGVVGVITMAGGYLAGGFLVIGDATSLGQVPGNLIQGVVGVVLGLLVAAAVRRAYPPVRQWKW